ncbi:MAG: DUF1822 family protein [Rivularia sp. (in: cyanobacteria)]
MMSNNQINDNQDKNTVLVLKGNYQQFNQLQSLYQSGELEKHLGIPILDLKAVSPHKNLDSISSKKNRNSTSLFPLRTEIEKKAINLRQWFDSNLDSDWKLFQVVAPTAYRSTSDEISNEAVTRGKQIKLNDAVTIALVITLSPPNEDGEVEIIIKICPKESYKYLPSGLKITLLDEFDDVFEELQANEEDSWLGLRFTASEGQFSINFTLEDVIVKQKFEI